MKSAKELIEELSKYDSELEISERRVIIESIEDELKSFGIDIDELELQLLIVEYTIPQKFKSYFAKEIRNNLSDEQKKKRVLIKYIGNWKVIFINNGFDKYKFLDIEEIK